MRRIFTVFAFPLAFIFNAYAQDPCANLIIDGLYQKINITTRSSFNQDLRTYFLSEQFKTDVRKGSWGANFSIPVEGVPFSLGANSSDDKFTEFRNKILSIATLNISADDFVSISKQLPNPDLYNAYNECHRIEADKFRVGLIRGAKIENEETVIFNFYYRPASVNEKAPKVQSITIEPKNLLISSGGLEKGKRIPSFLMSVICRRSEANEVVCNLQTESGSVSDKSEATKSSKAETPIGTIITSFLSFERFREAVSENGTWKTSSKWAPCDGREVVNSIFSKHSGSSRVPDLRGMFLRGLNTFDFTPPTTVSPVDPNRRDPEDRAAGSFQNDQNRSHNHDAQVSADRIGNPDGSSDTSQGIEPNNSYWRGNKNLNSNTAPTTASGGSESRPKNVAVYYYIKIN